MDPIQRSVTFFFFSLKTNQKHLFTINLYFYTIWRNQQHVNRKSLYNVAMKQNKNLKKIVYIYIHFICKTHTLKCKWKTHTPTNKPVNCNEKLIAVNILVHSKVHTNLTTTTKKPTKSNVSLSFPSTHKKHTTFHAIFHASKTHTQKTRVRLTP